MKTSLSLKNSITILCLICCFTSQAQTQFQISLGNTSRDFATGIAIAPDGNYIVSGEFFTPGLNYDFVVSKISTLGNLMWSKKIGSLSTERAICITKAALGGYIIAGRKAFATFDAYVVKIGEDGNLQWAKTYGTDTTSETVNDIKPTTDGGFIIGSSSDFVNNIDMSLSKIDAMGNLQWMKTYTPRGTIFSTESISSVLQLTDGSYTGVGEFAQTSGIYGVGAIHTDGNGVPIWSKRYFLPEFQFTNAKSFTTTPDGGYMITGRCSSADSNFIFSMKITANGNLVYFKKYSGRFRGEANSIIRAADGNYVIGGTDLGGPVVGTNNEILLRIDEAGNIVSSNTFGGINDDEITADVLQTLDGGYIFAGSSNSFSNGNMDDDQIIITKVNADRSSGITCDLAPTTFTTETLLPVETSFIMDEVSFGAAANDVATVSSNSNFIAATACQGLVVLAQNKIELNAHVINEKTIEVKWKLNVNNEAVKHFTLQKSTNTASSFIDINKQDARPNKANYIFEDVTPHAAINLYRLKTIALDGSTVFSEVKKVAIKTTALNRVQIFPNPVVTTAVVQLNAASNQQHQFNLIDNTGKVVFTKTMNGNTNFNFSRSGLQTGLYFYKVSNSNEVISSGKLTIQ